MFLRICLPTLLRRFPPLELSPLVLVATAELRIIVIFIITIIIPRGSKCIRTAAALLGLGRRGRSSSRGLLDGPGIDEIAGVEGGVLVLLDEVAQGLVARVDELVGGQAGAVAHPRAGAGLEHHLDQRVAELALRRRLAVDPADGAVQGRVPVRPVRRVALEVGLVEEQVDDLVCDCPYLR